MMKLFRNPRGAVSIFLVIILVPMLTISALFVDASKLMLGKGVVVSAGDLALNTALTNYDTKLKDLYGLFATAQDMDDLFGRLEDYYRTCITSSGVADEEADAFTDRIMAQLGMVASNDDTADILNMDLVEFSVEKRTDATLANATVLKRQIVDFMKYRAPINTGLSFLSALQSFTTLSKQTELVEKRKDYYTEEEGVMRSAHEAWKEINEYNKSGFITNSNYFNEMKDNFDGNESTGVKSYQERYEEIAVKIMRDLYDTQSYINYTPHTYQIYMKDVEVEVELEPEEEETEEETEEGETEEGEEETEEEEERETETVTLSVPFFAVDSVDKSVFTDYGTYDNGENKPTEGQVKNAITQYYDARNNFLNAQADLENLGLDRNIESGQTQPNWNNPSSEHYTYDLRYLVKNNRQGNLFQKWVEKMETLYTRYNEMRHAVWYADADIMNARYAICGETSSQSLFDYYNKFVRDFEVTADNAGLNSLAGVFNLDVQEYNTALSQFKTNVDARNATDKAPTEQLVKDLYTQIKGYKDTVDSAKEHLTNACTHLQAVYDGVKDGGTLDVARGNWQGVANDSQLKNNAMAKQDKAEIDSLGKYWNPEDVQKLINRIQAVIPNLEALSNEIDSYAFFGKKFLELTDYNTLNTQIGTVIGANNIRNLSIYKTEMDMTLTNEDGTGYADGKFQVGTRIDITWNSLEGQQADLTVGSKPAFYSYLYTKFNTGEVSTQTTEKEEDKENGEDLYNNLKSQSSSNAESTADDATGGSPASSNELVNTAHRPSASAGSTEATPGPSKVKTGDDAVGSSGDGGKTSSSGDLSGMMKNLTSALVDLGTGLRDRLYVSDYVLSMFSYDTIEAEYKKQQEEKGNSGEEVQLKTLTLVPIDAEHNYAYGREVEYIIYGGTNSSNIAKAYASIYAIRLAFNLVYAFMNSEIRDTALAVATPISAATLGIIPVPLIQAVIIIAIACCESALDLTLLKGGEKVPLFKNDKTWHFSVSGMINLAKDKGEEFLQEKAEQLIDEGTKKLGEMLDMADEELEEYIRTNETDFMNSVDGAYDDLVTRHAESAVQKMTSLVAQAVEQYAEKPAEEIVGIVKRDLQAWLDEENGRGDPNDIAFKVRQEAMNVILNSGEDYVAQYVQEVKNAGADIQNSVENLGGTVLEKVQEIKEAINTKIHEATGELMTYKDQLKDDIRQSMNEGADKLKDTINDKLDGVFGSIDGGDVDLGGAGASGSSDETGLASLLSFSYSDYLRLFLLIGLYTNEEGVILRTADVIQANIDMAQKKENANAPAYLLEKAGVYIQLKASVQVKPTLLALPLFSEVGKNAADDTNWYTITYSDVRGY